MSDTNTLSLLTEVQREGLKLAYRQGKKFGNKLKARIEAGELDLETITTLVFPIEELDISESFPMWTQALIKVGSSETVMVANGTFCGFGMYTGGRSFLLLQLTNSDEAKKSYMLSIFFSTAAVISGGSAALARSCQLSAPGVVSEAFGYAFMCLGNEAHKRALEIEAQRLRHRQQWFARSFRRGQTYNYNGYSGTKIAFTMPSSSETILVSEIIEKIPFQQIGQIVGISITIYTYSRIIIIGYRYGQKLIAKYRLYRLKKQQDKLRQQVQFVAFSLLSLKRQNFIRTRKKIWIFATCLFVEGNSTNTHGFYILYSFPKLFCISLFNRSNYFYGNTFYFPPKDRVNYYVIVNNSK